MSRLAIVLCLVLAMVERGSGQEFEEKIVVQEKGNGLAWALKGKANVKKTDDGYEFDLWIDASREGRDGTTKGSVVLILLNEKCEPKHFVASVGTKVTTNNSDGVGSRTGGAGVSCVVSAKQLKGATGYVMIVTTKGGDEYPSETLRGIKQFLRKEVPAWPDVARAYKELKAGDKSKSVGPAVVRKLR